MSVGFLVVYTGEETIRCRLHTKVEERQVHIRNDPGEIKAGMKAIDVDRKMSHLFSTSGGGTCRRYVICTWLVLFPYTDQRFVP